MFTSIKRLLGLTPSHPSQHAQPVLDHGPDIYDGDDVGDYAITRYPPFDQGIPLTKIDKLIHSQQELITRIFRTAGVSRADFEQQYEPVIRNLARHVHLLPATSTTYFRGTGGLFRMSLEVGLNSLQSANVAVFPVGGGVERRFFIQPKWSLATFLAGLCSQNYRTVNSMAVLTRNHQQWTPLLSHLYDWAEEQGADVYFVRWMDDVQVQGAQACAAYSISQVVPHEVLQWLASDNNQVVPSMTAAIAGVETNASENPISRLVAPVITRVIEDDLKRSATNYGHLVIGAHLEPHLVDAMRRLVRSGKWVANNQAAGGRLWVGAEGVFIDWPTAAQDISNLLSRDSFAGIPKDQDTLADLLVNAGLLQPTPKGSRYWTITVPNTLEAKDGMVKLKQGEVIFPQGFDFEPFRNVQLTLTSTPNPSPVPPKNTGTATQPAAPAKSDQASTVAPEKKSNQDSNTASKEETASTPGQGRKRNKPKPPAHAPSKAEEVSPAENMPPFEEVPLPESIPDCDEGAETGVSAGRPNSSSADRLLGSLKKGNAWLLQEVVNNYHKKTLTGVVADLPYGVGISHDELSAHGQPVMELFEELAMKQWLWQDKTRLSRRIHPVEVDGKTYKMMVLKPDIAAGLGFGTAKT